MIVAFFPTIIHDQVTMPRLKAMTWNMADQDTEILDPVAVINLKVPTYPTMYLFEEVHINHAYLIESSQKI